MNPLRENMSFDSRVEILAYRENELFDRQIIKNTTLKVGRRELAAALGGNLLSVTHEAFVETLEWGDGGLDGSNNIRAVPETSTGFVGGGTVFDSTAVVANLVGGDEATVIFSAALGTSASSNGNKISQIGLKMNSGSYWAITTWAGIDKDALTTISINWTVYFL